MIRIATVFSGIGAAEQALQQMKVPHEIIFACDNGERYLEQTKEEIDEIIAQHPDMKVEDVIRELYDDTQKPNNVKKSYFANYDIDESRWFEDIRFIDGRPFKGKVDLFVGGSPCQSFSTYGHKRGLEDKVRHDFHGVGVISCISDHSITVHFKNSTINRKLKNFQVTCSFDKKPSEVESLSLCY